MSNRSSSPLIRLVALVAVLGLVAAACGGDDEPSSGGGGGGDYSLVRTEIPVPDGEPVYGGRLVYAVESDTSSPWTPQQALCAVSCHMVMRTVFDPLTLVNDAGEWQPFLASAVEPNDDYTEWTITARDGITFHDGEPFDGAAIAANLEGHLRSTLTGTILRDVTEITSDGQTATVTLGSPWVHFPFVLSLQPGYMASPKWLAEAQGDPAVSSKPVGTGPFKFKSYESGAQAVYVGERNDDYWIEGLPYLDEIEIRALPNSAQRIEGIRNDQIDISLESGGIALNEVRGDDSLVVVENRDFSETDYLLLNGSNPEHETSDVRVRRAMAHAIDPELYVELREEGLLEPANGPFNPTMIGFLDDTGYPGYDPDEAKRLVDEYEAENGPITITVKTTTDPANAETIELLRSAWSDVGIDSDTDEVPQNAFIVQALAGNFEAFLWRLHAGVHPDMQNHWWHGDVASSGSALKINFGRIDDEVINDQLDIIRQSDDPATVEEAAEEINRRFGEQAYNLWLDWTVWTLVARPVVQNPLDMKLPDTGDSILPFGNGIGGAHWVAQIWKSDA